MAEKNLNNIRIVNKHDIEENWLKATGFTPKQGELIVYDIDDNYNYERIKIGDGINNVNALPFYAGSWNDLSDKPFGQSIVLGRIIAEEQVAEVNDGIVQTIESKPFKENKTYLIKINDNEYIANSKYVDAAAGYCCGNAFFAYPDLVEDTGEPFYVENDYMGSYKRVFLYTSLADTEVTISITEVDGYSTQTLDEIYIPDTIARVSDVEDAIAAIPAPDVSGQIEEHNTSETAHSDIRAAISDVSTLVGDTAVSEQINTAIADKAGIANGQYAVTATSDDGVAYIATVPSVTALITGVSFIMIPGKTSASTTPTLNVNGLGAKNIRRRLSNLATAVQAGYTTTWLAVNRPFRVTYDGTQWIVEGHEKPVGADLYGAAAKATADANGNVITDTYATISALQAMLPKVTSITLNTSWSGTASPYYQDVTLSCCTETSMVDIQPTPAQLASWQDDGLAFTTLSGTGTVRVYVAGGKPTEAIAVQVKVQEVVVI